MHPHQTPFTQSSELYKVNGSLIEIMSNEIRLYYLCLLCNQAHIKNKEAMVQHTAFINSIMDTCLGFQNMFEPRTSLFHFNPLYIL